MGMSEVELTQSHRNIRNELYKLCIECIRNLSESDPKQAAAFVAAVGMNKYELATEIKLIGASTDLKICLVDKLGGKQTVFHIPIIMDEGGIEH